jgi:enoyl-CoA hydratase/carnithine racemase
MALAMAILLEGDGSINENPERQPMDELLYEVRDGVAYVTFNRPQARNALTFAMYERLAEICTNANADRSIRAILITGGGDKAFAAGTDISQFRTFDKEQDALDYEARIDRVMNAIERCRVPTIAAINGACTGGGASIAACCDLRIASRSMKYGFPVARTLGNCLSLPSYNRLVYLVGPALVKDIVFQSRLIEADEALAKGLVMELTENQETLLKRAEEITRSVASHAPLTLQATKEALLRLRPKVEHGEGNDLVLMCYMSQDFREGMEAFLNKRKPVWKGR